jgi:hypothetical protein
MPPSNSGKPDSKGSDCHSVIAGKRITNVGSLKNPYAVLFAASRATTEKGRIRMASD